MFVGYIDSRESDGLVDYQRQLLLSYAESHQFSIDLFYDKSILNLKKDIISDQKTIVFANACCLGDSFEKVQQSLEYLYKANFETILVQEDVHLPATAETEQVIAGVKIAAQIKKNLMSVSTRKGLAKAVVKGTVLGRTKGCKNKKYKLDDYVEELKKYLAKGWTYQKIEKLLNISWKTIKTYVESHPYLNSIVQKKLNEFSKDQRGFGSSRGILENADEQIRKMLDEGFPRSAIAEHFGVTRATLFKKLHLMGIETNRESILVHFDDQKFVDLYQAGMPLIRMAKYFNCHVLTIKKHVQDLGLTREKSIRVKPTNTILSQLENSKDEIKQLFDEGWSYKKIADELNCDDTYICKLIKKWGWDKRNVTYSSYALDEHKSEVIKLVQQGFTVKQIALRYSVGCPTVVKSLKRWGIEVKK